MESTLSKGSSAEETLRNYFLSIGYYAARSCKFRYGKFDVTDIDLWLYGKKSPLNRERLNVDIKNKKTPQALERIFWAKGLQDVLNLEGCVVATTDNRPEVRAFGLQHGVKVLDGHFINRVGKSERLHQERITEERFLSELERESMGKFGGNFIGRYESSKSRLLDGMNFDGCNAWLYDLDFFMRRAIESNFWRGVYAVMSCFILSVDFILHEHIAADHDQRLSLLDSGFRFGSAGRVHAEKVGKLAASLVQSATGNALLSETVRDALNDQISIVRADILAEYLARGSGQPLFDAALEFESCAFAVGEISPNYLGPSAQAFLGLIADFHGLDRKLVLV